MCVSKSQYRSFIMNIKEILTTAAIIGATLTVGVAIGMHLEDKEEQQGTDTE